MASSVIHLCVANEVNKRLKRDNRSILIGSIAPDISKQIGETKTKSHFLTDNTDIPNLNLFLEKYKTYLNDDFVLGYYIHLYTDYIWFKYFLPDFVKKDFIFKKDGKVEYLSNDKKCEYIYSDYTNLNILLIDIYNFDISIFYEEVPSFKNIITEIPMDKLDIIINKAGVIIENSKVNKPYIFDIKDIKKFISLVVDMTLSNLDDLNIKQMD